MPRVQGTRPSKAGLDGSYAVGDLIGYKAHFRAPKSAGYVDEVGPHHLYLKDARSGRRILITPGRKGSVWKLHGQGLLDVQATLPREPDPEREPTPDQPRAPLRLIHAGPAALRAISREWPPIESLAFRRWIVRTFLCLSCEDPRRPVDPHHAGPDQRAYDLLCVPTCRECHDFYHDHGRFPDQSVEDTALLFLGAHVALLLQWHIVLQDLLAPPPALPLPAEEQALLDILSEREGGEFHGLLN